MSTAVIGETRAIALRQPRKDVSRTPEAESDAPRANGNVEAADRAGENQTSRSATVMPLAPFVAQLIATQQSLPQTRARNRAEPAAAALAYRMARRN
jgi:hypothetical protein